MIDVSRDSGIELLVLPMRDGTTFHLQTDPEDLQFHAESSLGITRSDVSSSNSRFDAVRGLR